MIRDPSPDARRADPDALLRQAAREERGRLKVFLGAAPGVGKTYEMLSEGIAHLKAGEDVVIGLVETHGRAETQALTGPLPLIERCTIEKDGRVQTEMDIDTILARRPKLALVDELAHSNVPGSRHPKRWQDIEEMLDAGINVYSTLNIQHVESLNDIVASFTKVRVRETVPDHVLEQAEIEIVDIPPDELIERLRQGKVYVPQEAARALNHFFSKSNLSALRELALRRAAQAVDAQMLDYLKAHAMGGAYAGGERVLVAIDEQPSSTELVRAGKRLADALHAPWTVIHIEAGRSVQLGPKDRSRLAETLALAAQLGAATSSFPARSIVSGLIEQARELRATQIILGKSTRSWWFEFWHGSVVDQVVRNAGDLAIHVLPAGRARQDQRGMPITKPELRPSIITSALVVTTTAIAIGLLNITSVSNISMLFLIPVLIAASRFGLGQGLYASLLSALAYNFFFLPPLHTFTISNPENIIAFLVLFATAVVTSKLASGVRIQADLAVRSARQNAALAGFSQLIAGAVNRDELAQIICGELGRLFRIDVVLAIRGKEGAEIIAAVPPQEALGQIETAALNWALDKVQPAGLGTDTLTSSDWSFRPIVKNGVALAVIGYAKPEGGRAIRPDEVPLLISLMEQSGLAIDRQALNDDLQNWVQASVS